MRHALIFAAGRGERMRPLTDTVPKPLLVAGGKPLIVWQLEKLAAAGIREVVINTSHLASQFPTALGDGSRWGLHIQFAYEGDTPLETGGGMLHALPLLGDEPFLVLNADIWCDADLTDLPAQPEGLAHLLLVDNPPQHAGGDFALDRRGRLHADGTPKLTYAGIGVYRPQLLAGWREVSADATASPPRFKLAPLLRAAMAGHAVSGTRHTGTWFDIGTPARLQALRDRLGDSGHATR